MNLPSFISLRRPPPSPRTPFVWHLALRAVVLAIILAFPPLPYPCQANTPPKVEHDQLKAVFLYNFLHFVTWPAPHGVPDTAQAQVIGVVGDSPVLAALQDLATTIQEKSKTSLRILDFGSYRNGMELGACHILFVSASEQRHMPQIIASLRQRPVLTVADTDSFLSAGGMITMLEQQQRIRYHINRTAALKAGLRLSSQLLKTAIDVQDDERAY